MMLYSAHDVTLAPILLLLGVLDDKWPDFAADIAFELYRDKVQLYTQSICQSYGNYQNIFSLLSEVIYKVENFLKLSRNVEVTSSANYWVKIRHNLCNKSINQSIIIQFY